MRYCIIILWLAGCTPIFFNEPNLAQAPLDQEKYHVDLKSCEEAQRPSVAETLTGGMGVVPATTVMIAEGRGGSLLDFKSGYTIRDECMQKMGYKLKDK